MNICKIHDCPTIPLMERYPMGLTLFEPSAVSDQESAISSQKSVISEETVKQVREFCEKNKGKEIPFEQIREMYWEYTPEEVGKIFYQTIQEAIIESKQK